MKHLLFSLMVLLHVGSSVAQPQTGKHSGLPLFSSNTPPAPSFRMESSKMSLDSMIVEDYYKDTYTYNEDGFQQSLTSYYWSTGGKWVFNYTSDTQYAYDSQGNLISQTIPLYSKEEFTYDTNNTPVFSASYSWNSGSSSWDSEGIHYYDNTFTSSKQLASSNKYHLVGSEKMYSERKEYAYDANNHLILEIDSDRDSSNTQWLNLFKSEYENDKFGNPLVEIYYYWSSSDSSWTPTEKYDQVYDTTVFQQTLIVPNWAHGHSTHKMLGGTYYQWFDWGWDNPRTFTVFYSDFTTDLASDLSLSSIKSVYPNPCKDHLSFLGNKADIQGYDILSLAGTVVASQKGTIQTIETSSLSSGTYFLKLYGSSSYNVLKFVKE